jgi:hypothetical protein
VWTPVTSTKDNATTSEFVLEMKNDIGVFGILFPERVAFLTPLMKNLAIPASH